MGNCTSGHEERELFTVMQTPLKKSSPGRRAAAAPSSKRAPKPDPPTISYTDYYFECAEPSAKSARNASCVSAMTEMSFLASSAGGRDDSDGSWAASLNSLTPPPPGGGARRASLRKRSVDLGLVLLGEGCPHDERHWLQVPSDLNGNCCCGRRKRLSVGARLEEASSRLGVVCETDAVACQGDRLDCCQGDGCQGREDSCACGYHGDGKQHECVGTYRPLLTVNSHDSGGHSNALCLLGNGDCGDGKRGNGTENTSQSNGDCVAGKRDCHLLNQSSQDSHHQ